MVPVYRENVSEKLSKIIEIKVTHNDLFLKLFNHDQSY